MEAFPMLAAPVLSPSALAQLQSRFLTILGRI